MTYHAPTENGAEKLPWIQYPLIPLDVESPLPRQLVLPGTIDEKLVSVLKNVCPMLAVSLGRDVATDEACTATGDDDGGFDATSNDGGGGEDGGGKLRGGGDAATGAGVCCALVASNVMA